MTPGEERVTVAAGHVFPGEEHGVLAGDRYELTDGDQTTAVTLCEPLAVGEQTVTLGVKREIDAAFDGEEAVLRPTEATLRDEIVGVRSAFDRLGYDPDAFVFPYDAADPRAWVLAAETYDALPNAAVRSLPNRPGTAPTSYQRCYLERGHLWRAEIETYLDSVATQGGLGILAGHSAWETVPPERVAFVIEAARQRGIEVTTFSGLYSISAASSTPRSPRSSAARMSSVAWSGPSSPPISASVTFSLWPTNSSKSVPSASAVSFLTR